MQVITPVMLFENLSQVEGETGRILARQSHVQGRARDSAKLKLSGVSGFRLWKWNII